MAGVALVRVTGGPGAGLELKLALGESAVIGRGADAQLRVPDPQISRKHLEVEHRAEGVLVRDLGSKHGAALDGRPIPREGALVALRATLLVGESKLEIRRSPAKTRAIVLPGIRLQEKLGEGASGEVFAAFQDPPGRRVAVKALAREADEVTRKRVEREAYLQGKLEHPGIVRVFELIQRPKRLYLVRELVEGETLDDSLKSGPLEWRRAVEVGAQVAEALAHAHERGIVHRDVKPANVLIERATGTAKLADFDLARDAAGRPTLADATKLTKTTEQLGTMCYIAPEQFDDSRHASEKADVYGLAAVVYHALSGERPFQRIPGDDYVRALFGDGPTPLAEVAPQVPREVATLVMRGLSVAAPARPTAAELAAELWKLAGRKPR